MSKKKKKLDGITYDSKGNVTIAAPIAISFAVPPPPDPPQEKE